MKEIQKYLQSKEDIQSIIKGVQDGFYEQLIAGVSGSARSLLVGLIQRRVKRKMLLVTHQLTQAQKLYDDLVELIGRDQVFLYPVNELIASEMFISSPELKSERIDSLLRWLSQSSGILITPVSALKRIVPPQSYWAEYQLDVSLGGILQIEDVSLRLVDMGYDRTEMVTSPGEFSIRGGIIDIYPLTEEHPVRIELFDDEIDSIRYFDAEDQRSIDKIDQITIDPAIEILLKKEDFLRGINRIEESLSQTLKNITKREEKERLLEFIHEDLERLKAFERFEGIYKYMNFFYDEPASLLDYLPANGLILFDELSRIQEVASSLDYEEAEWYTSLLSSQQMVKSDSIAFDWHHIWGKFTHQKLYFSTFLRHISNTKPENVVNISSREMQEFHGQIHLFKNELSRWEKGDYSVFILAPNDERAKKIQDILTDYGIDSEVSQNYTLPKKSLTIIKGLLNNGIELPMHKVAIVTENELFKQRTRTVQRRHKISNAERIKNYQELKVGDYVVHANHGIGKYLGIETVKINNVHKDYMVIKYQGDDRLYVPIDQIDLVQKFVGSEGKEPRIYKLGGSEWTKVKKRVQSSVEDIADELIKLYAEREAKKGFAFSPDTELQREFEAAFPYQETEDQLKCIEEIKQDMERDRPMDRLLCGDVGYGKTEVAIRAAFKAVMDGKQVAVLVPTTILAQQHYQTFRERFQNFPVTIDMLSRFRTQAEQRKTILQLEKGMVDIIIGTHRLLSKDVKYHDLGLLIVDEEQRFGVKHKEKIKQVRTNIDVLTLTATPIPRTLHMSMIGVRDLSIIETPPENRFPVQTYVLEYNPIFIREAIEREIARDGQVFFLYNRVENIERMKRELESLIPDARIAIAHGQMNETELENIMLSFLEGEYDVLVSTTIIETGVDIPNVNTLIVYNADQMGLSQLYQLRGRVGRSNRIAYAHFTYQRDKVLSEVAEKRLQAIKEFTELGSGFKIAMRDLAIRGAGNLLGAEQHGFIDSVGFDMYSQMLKDAIDARKEGKDVKEIDTFEPELSLNIDAYIPESYIEDEKQKIDMYKQFQLIQTEEDIELLREELIDRYGDYPEQVENLFSVATIKLYATKERVELVQEENRKIELIIEEERSQKIDGAKLFEVAHQYGRAIQLGTFGNKLKIVYQWDSLAKDERYQVISQFICQLEKVDRDE